MHKELDMVCGMQGDKQEMACHPPFVATLGNQM